MSVATLSPPVGAVKSSGVSPLVSDAELRAKYPTKEAVLQAVASGGLSIDAASIALAALAPKVGRLAMKVGPAGGVCLYGLQRQPVTLYVSQWERLLEYADEIRTFIGENLGKRHTGTYTAANPARGIAKGQSWEVVLTRAKKPGGAA